MTHSLWHLVGLFEGSWVGQRSSDCQLNVYEQGSFGMEAAIDAEDQWLHLRIHEMKTKFALHTNFDMIRSDVIIYLPCVRASCGVWSLETCAFNACWRAHIWVLGIQLRRRTALAYAFFPVLFRLAHGAVMVMRFRDAERSRQCVVFTHPERTSDNWSMWTLGCQYYHTELVSHTIHAQHENLPDSFHWNNTIFE